MYEFRLPDLGEGVAEGEVVRWLVRVGDSVGEDQPLVEVMTDKATVEIPSPVSGTIARLAANEGDVVPVGTVLVVVATEAVEEEKVAARVSPAPGAEKPHALALPSVRRLARELAVDLSTVVPTGPHQRITADDVRKAGNGAPRRRDLPSDDAPPTSPLTGVRRVIAARLEAAALIPAVTIVEECDVTEVEETRQAATRPLSYLSFVVRACVRALLDHPDLNCLYEDGGVVRPEAIDIGVAVHTDAGLMVPVLRAADTRTLGQIHDQIADLAERARSGQLSPDELRGGTFTVTSAGAFGGVMATPLLNPPQVGILGVHRVGPRPAVRGDQVVIRTMGNLSITFDHRVVDGVPAGRFLHDVVRTLEHPGLLLV